SSQKPSVSRQYSIRRLVPASAAPVVSAKARTTAGLWKHARTASASGVRKSLIVNYVKPEWRARRELAYPETPVAD
ncbi:MAG: hypothetical protein ACKOEE_12750, partial [Tagaea sp.]